MGAEEGNAFIKAITICGEFALLTVKRGRRLCVRAWAWQLCSHGLALPSVDLCGTDVFTYPRRRNTPMEKKHTHVSPFVIINHFVIIQHGIHVESKPSVEN